MIMKKNILTLLLSMSILHADTLKSSGDALRLILPSVAFITPLYLKDYEGQKQYIKTFVLNGAITYALKFNIKKERPDGSDSFSFPSGHTSLAFSAATFIHFRYGLSYALPAYGAAVFVGYTRVASHKHYIEDVIAGGAVGVLSAYLLTSPYDNLNITPIFSHNFKGIKLNYSFYSL